MQSEEQFEQLILQYNQLKNGALDIASMIEKEDYDSAITFIKSREQVFLNCKCIRNYLELTPVQKNQLDKIVEELKELELNNIKKLEEGMEAVQRELTKAQKSQKLQNAYDNKAAEGGGSLFSLEN